MRNSSPKTILDVLDERYRDYPKTVLKHEDVWQLLAVVMLSAQTTDQQVNKASPALFRKYPTVQDMAEAGEKDIQEYVKSLGFYRNKAKNLKNAAKMIVNEYDGKVPEEMRELVKLPGVARKTANIVLYAGYDKVEGIAVDTHVKRLSNRLGWTENKNPDKIERDLMETIPKNIWGKTNHILVYHGRETCTAKKPSCSKCVIKDYCPKRGVET